MDAPIKMHWERGLVPRRNRTPVVNPIIQQPLQNRELNRVEQGLEHLQSSVNHLTEMVYFLRDMGVETASGLEETRQEVLHGTRVTELSEESLSKKLTRVSKELKQELRTSIGTVLANSRARRSWNPMIYIYILWIYWCFVIRMTILAWQSTIHATAMTMNFLSANPITLYCCGCCCYAVEGIMLIVISDLGLIAATCGISHCIGLEIQLFYALIYLCWNVPIFVYKNMVNCTLHYFRPYAAVIQDVTGVTPQSVIQWFRSVTAIVSKYIGGIVEEKVREQVEPITNGLRDVSQTVYNSTVGLLPNTTSILGMVDVSSLGESASSAAASASEFASSAAASAYSGVTSTASGLVSRASGLASGASGLASRASGLASGASGLASKLPRASNVAAAGLAGMSWFRRDTPAEPSEGEWKGLGGGDLNNGGDWKSLNFDEFSWDDPFQNINLLQGQELVIFNKSKVGKYLKILEKKFKKEFKIKYTKGDVSEENVMGLLQFMNKISLIILDIIPHMAHLISVSEPIQVEPGLRIALIQSALGSTITPVKRKTLKMGKKKKRKTIRFS